MERQACHTPASHVVLVTQAGDEPIPESGRGLARRADTAGNPEVDLTDEAPSRAADHSLSPPVTQRPATLGHPTPDEGEALLFENLDEGLENLWHKNARWEKQCKIECLCV
jgi:hypothetical protein